MGDGSRQIIQHRFRYVEARMMGAGRSDPRFQDSEPQLFAERAHLHDEAAGQPRADPVVEAFEIGRRTVGGDHHLAAGVDQRIQRVAELGLGRFALQELQIVDHEHVDAAQCLLERQRCLRFERGDEAVHELLGGEIKHLALGARVAGPCHRLQQMGFAEADAGVDVERIEHHGIAAPAFGDLTRGGVRQRVGAADHETCECQARIERRAAQRIMAGGHRRGRGGAQFGRGTAIGALGTALIGRRRGFLDRGRAAHRRAHGEIDPMHFRHFGLPAGQNAIGVMRLDPALEEPGRNRQMDAFVLHALQVHARKPARIDVFADARAQPTFYPRPAILFDICHCLRTFLKEYWCCEIAVQVSCHGATSSEASCSGHRSTVRPNRRRANHRLEKKRPRGQRVLDGLSGVRAKGWVKVQSRVSDMVPFEICISNAAMIP